jgi:hypothetical protein
MNRNSVPSMMSLMLFSFVGGAEAEFEEDISWCMAAMLMMMTDS